MISYFSHSFFFINPNLDLNLSLSLSLSRSFTIFIVNGLGTSATADKLIGAEDNHHVFNSIEESQSTVCLTKGCVAAGNLIYSQY